MGCTKAAVWRRRFSVPEKLRRQRAVVQLNCYRCGRNRLDPIRRRRIFPTMVTIVKCDCGAEYKRTEAKFLVPHTGHASCRVCGAVLESWMESIHVAKFELIKRPDGKAGTE